MKKEKVFEQGDGISRATVTENYTTCYMCDPSNKTTEVCVKHFNQLKEGHELVCGCPYAFEQ